MRKLLLLVAAGFIVAIVFAPAAMAQASNCVPQQAYVPKVNGCVAIEGFAPPEFTQGDAIVFDAATGEEIGPLRSIIVPEDVVFTEDGRIIEAGAEAKDTHTESGTPAVDQYADDDMTALPDTGGPALLPLAVLFVGLGALIASSRVKR